MPTLKTLITKINMENEEKLIDNKWNICKKKVSTIFIYTKKKQVWKY